jgi:Domain of unknown function (DUF1906)/FG-GAP-like repeat
MVGGTSTILTPGMATSSDGSFYYYDYAQDQYVNFSVAITSNPYAEAGLNFLFMLQQPFDGNNAYIQTQLADFSGIAVQGHSRTLAIDPADKVETVAIPLQWGQVTGGAIASDTAGQIHFTDPNQSTHPFATITGAPIIVVEDAAGNDVTSELTSSQLAMLQTSFTITPEAGNTNNGIIDWKFSYHGTYYDLDFLAGKHVTVANTVTVSDQNGQSQTATITNTLDLPQYAGIDYRYPGATDPLVPSASDIRSAGIGIVGEYLGGGSSYLTQAKAQALISAGLHIFSIYEHAGMDTAAYYANAVAEAHGITDATNAINNALKVGQTAGSAVYFGIDLDPAAFGGDLSGVVSYFDGVKSVFDAASTHFKVGVYGGGDVLQMIKDETGLATYAFLAESTGWAGSKTYDDWNIEQVRDPSLIGSTDFPHISDMGLYFNNPAIGEQDSSKGYIAGDLTQGPTGAWGIGNVAKLDFGGDGVSDILFHNDDGTAAIYDMHADGSSNAIQLGMIDPVWKIEDTPNFGNGSNDDILWQNSSSGQIVYWSVTAGQTAPGYTDLGTLGPQWQIQSHDGASDFIGDGADDILFRDTSSNLMVFWNMQGGKAADTVVVGSGPNSDWSIAGTGDFNGDGKSDILWHNDASGDALIWASGGTGPTTQLGNINPAWQIAGIGDFKGDGVDDVLWFNTQTHQAVYWDDHANGTSTTVDLGIIPNGFTFDKPRDLTGDGTADFLLHNSSNGVLVSAANDGGSTQGFHVIDTLPTSWHII